MICEQIFTENILKIIDKLNDFFYIMTIQKRYNYERKS